MVQDNNDINPPLEPDDPQDPVDRGPIGDGEHTVRVGECVTSLAARKRLLSTTIWNDPANAEFHDASRHENVLLPGDRVTIPPIRRREEPCQTEMLHRFVCETERAILRVRLLHLPLPDSGEPGEGDEDGGCLCCEGEDPNDVLSEHGTDDPGDPGDNYRDPLEDAEPLADRPFVLKLNDGAEHRGITDPDGYLWAPISPTARRAVALVGEEPDQLRFEFLLGHLDPVCELRGVQQRLNNLGFWCGDVDGVFGPLTQQAVERYQKHHRLAVSRKPDDPTRSHLEKEHGS